MKYNTEAQIQLQQQTQPCNHQYRTKPPLQQKIKRLPSTAMIRRKQSGKTKLRISQRSRNRDVSSPPSRLDVRKSDKDAGQRKEVRQGRRQPSGQRLQHPEPSQSPGVLVVQPDSILSILAFEGTSHSIFIFQRLPLPKKKPAR